ncbi:MAG: enoyl-CoA hydratase-related protein [Mycetocola sp.]
MSQEKVRLEVRDGVALVTLNHPSARNALDLPMAKLLAEACDTIDQTSTIGAVVIQAEGEAFCAGADRELLTRAAADPSSDENVAALNVIYRAFTRVGQLEPPVIAAVRGPAVGAGINLALAADLRLMGISGTFISGFGKIGLHPGGGHFALIGRAAGRQTAAALSIFGAPVSAQRALELGFAWEVHADEEVNARAFELAARAARDPALARASARSMRLELGPPAVSWAAALEIERGVQMWSMTTSQRGRGS